METIMPGTKIVQPIEYRAALEYYRQFPEETLGFLFESVDTAPLYGRMSIMGIDPALEVMGSGERFTIRALNRYGRMLLGYLPAELFSYAEDLAMTVDTISGRVPRQLNQIDEAHRQQQLNTSAVIRTILERFQNQDPQFGLYGAFSYDFVRLFEDLPGSATGHSVDHDTNDFHLYIPDLLYRFDHMKETAEIVYYNFSQVNLKDRLADIPRGQVSFDYTVGEMQAETDQAAYMQAVQRAQEYMRQGDIFELVLSRRFVAPFQGSSLGVYEQYRQANPSPYMFYVRFPDRVLLGASPEMFVRVENDTVMTRPISGTAIRSQDAIQDYQHMLDLLNSPKEKSELDMLIDLARNDLARVCLPGVQVTEYRYVEKYSKVMHTVAQVEGQLDTQRYTALDAFIACLNAGTLTGAPKIRAMELIDHMEPNRRGYYGGSVGYLTCRNELNTGIIIRAAEIRSRVAESAADHEKTIITQAGASLVFDSDPAAEFSETEHKAAALLQVLRQKERVA